MSNKLMSNDPLATEFLNYVEKYTQEETLKIMKKYQEKMNEDLEAVRAKIVAQAGVRLSSMMSMQDMGRVIRIEITRRQPNDPA